MNLDEMTDDHIRGLIAEAQRTLDDRAALAGAEQAVRDAVAAYAGAAGLSADAAWAILSPLPATPSPAPDPVDAPEWSQPAGAHDAYPLGARVSYRGAVYESVLAGNAFSPAAYPQGWRKL